MSKINPAFLLAKLQASWNKACASIGLLVFIHMLTKQNILKSFVLLLSFSVGTFIISCNSMNAVKAPSKQVIDHKNLSNSELKEECAKLQRQIDLEFNFMSTSKSMVVENNDLTELEKEYNEKCKGKFKDLR